MKACGCRGKSGELKRSYGTQRQAQKAATSQGRTGAFRTYKCPNGKGWHITHA